MGKKGSVFIAIGLLLLAAALLLTLYNLWDARRADIVAQETVRELNRQLRVALGAYPQVRFNSPENAVPHILNLSVAGVKGTVFQRALSERGICVSVKSACSAEGTPSKAVFAVSRDRKNALSSWRISLSHLTTQEEIDQFLQAFGQCVQTLAPKKA